MGTEKPRPKPLAEKFTDLRGIDCRKAKRTFDWCCEWISYWLSRQPFLEVLEYVGKLGILIAIITFFYPGCRERKQATESAKQAAADARKSRHYVAWQTINSALGKPGNGGRSDALQDLSQDGIPMDGISLAGGVVVIGPLNVSNAKMTHADSSDGTYEKVNFKGATLDFSKWSNTLSERCNFEDVSFWAASFNNSTFALCDFDHALFQTQFTGDRSQFTLCNFAGAAFAINIWNSVEFSDCNFAYADLTHVFIGVNGFTNTSDTLFCCNLYGASASPDTIKFARHQLVAFTNVVSLEKWNYCVTNSMVVFQKGGPEFMNWASNQFAIYHKTNNPQAWLEWSRDNLTK